MTVYVLALPRDALREPHGNGRSEMASEETEDSFTIKRPDGKRKRKQNT